MKISKLCLVVSKIKELLFWCIIVSVIYNSIFVCVGIFSGFIVIVKNSSVVINFGSGEVVNRRIVMLIMMKGRNRGWGN